MCQEIGVIQLQTCRVPHGTITYALSLHLGERGEFKLTFSSDTTPCADLIELGQNSTLLIHEATYPNEYIENAERNRHCTVSQAIEQSKKMNAKYTILTHFSRHHGFFPFVDGNKYKNIGIAFDFMELTENDLPKLRMLNQKYQKCFGKNGNC